MHIDEREGKQIFNNLVVQINLYLFAFVAILITQIYTWQRFYIVPILILTLKNLQIILWVYGSQGSRQLRRLFAYEQISFLFIKIAIVFLLENVLTVYLVLPGLMFCAFIMRIMAYLQTQTSQGLELLLNFAIICIRLIQLLGVLAISLKLGNYVDWDWPQTFWWYWILFSIHLGILSGSTILVMTSLMQALEVRTTQQYQVLRHHFWWWQLSAFISAACYMWFQGTVSQQQDNNEKPLSVLLMISASYVVFFNMLSRGWRETIYQVFSQLILTEQAQVPDADLPRMQNPLVMIPTVLRRISNNYYTIGTTLDYQTELKSKAEVDSKQRKLRPRTYQSNADKINKSVLKSYHSKSINTEGGDFQMNPEFLTFDCPKNNQKYEQVSVLESPGMGQVKSIDCDVIPNRDPSLDDDHSLGRHRKVVSQPVTLPEPPVILLNTSQSVRYLNPYQQENKLMCSVCFENEADSIIMDCYHGGLCYDCAIKIWNKQGQCCICRAVIKQVLQIDQQRGLEHVKVISYTRSIKKR